MTLDQSALTGMTESQRTADEGTLMRHLLAVLQQLVDAEVTEKIGAGRYERSTARTTQRNGTRPKTVATTASDIEVQNPKLRTVSFFPSLMEPHRRIDRALHAVVCEAFVHGVSTRKVDDLVAALGVASGIAKSRPVEHGLPSAT
jgi:putative transposase